MWPPLQQEERLTGEGEGEPAFEWGEGYEFLLLYIHQRGGRQQRWDGRQDAEDRDEGCLLRPEGVILFKSADVCVLQTELLSRCCVVSSKLLHCWTGAVAKRPLAHVFYITCV